MCPYGYYSLMLKSKDPRYLRLKMIQSAKRLGVVPAAREHATTPKTIRKWRDRYDGTLDSLTDHSRAPKRPARKITPADEARIVRARHRLPTWGARRLKRDLQLPYSVKTIRRVIRKRGLARRWRRKKHETKRSLRAIKRLWRLWQQISIDTKNLCDLPEYWLQAQAFDLPRYQYTARDVTTGVLFLAYSNELSLTYAQLFAERIAEHLKAHQVRLSDVTVQTDNGSEFVGSWQAINPSAFTQTLNAYGISHRTIPPGAHRFQSDVETIHSLMEIEFFLEPFTDRGDFIRKAETYQDFFNYVRPNSGKENKSPWDLVQTKIRNPPLSLLHLPPVFLEELLHAKLHPPPGGDHVGVLPFYHP